VATLQISEPGNGHISRTTRMALDAQHRRTQARNVLRSRNGATKATAKPGDASPPKPAERPDEPTDAEGTARATQLLLVPPCPLPTILYIPDTLAPKVVHDFVRAQIPSLQPF